MIERDAKSPSNDKPDENILRNRHDRMEKEGSDESLNMISNPLKWFGILNPPALRNSQKRFVAGLNLKLDY